MLIKNIELNNIRSYINEKIKFPEGSILLSGDIGSGKSTILLAIEFALFGLQKGIMKGSSLLRNEADDGYVELELELNGKNIKIKRSLKRKKDSVVQDDAFIVEDNLKRELSVNELKKFVINELKYPSQFLNKKNDVYRYTVYTPQESMKEIIFADKEDRIDILRKVFNIDKYSRIKNSCEIFSAKIRGNIKNKEGKINDLPSKKEVLVKKSGDLKDIEEKIKFISPKIEEFRIKIEERRKEYELIEKRKEELIIIKNKLSSINSSLEEKNYSVKRIDANLAKIGEDIKKLSEKVGNFDQNQKEIIEKEVDDIKKEEIMLKEDILNYYRELAVLESENKNLESNVNKISKLEVCYTCMQKVGQEHKENITSNIKSKIEENNEKIRNVGKNIEKLGSDIKEKEGKIRNINEKIRLMDMAKKDFEFLRKIKEDFEKYKNEKKSLELEIKNLTEEKEKLEKTLLLTKSIEDKFKEIKVEMDNLKEEKQKLEIEKAKLDTNLKNLTKEIEEITKEIREKEKILFNLEKLKDLKDLIENKFLTVIFEIEKQVMLKLNQEFNNFFKKWFLTLVGDEQISARINIDFSPIIEQKGYELEYVDASGGEKTALALAYRLALNQVVNSTLSDITTNDLLILDEPTDGFSEKQLYKMRDVLNELKVKQLIIVSHEPKMESFVESVIKLEKEDNITKII
ncbi:hypothetical protein AUJ10_01965 [Candidatus Pacearchaeota archaeon CG1_02_31_27]|nr:MAG: hypothetical protein AUJ10_01965 [Candidatus Pacearchaeota archaeon CG1_02_31_27]PIN92565.1 MAG: hypothetical protein COU55_00035 [Candidatus Pacearchaeota archaeon CG10_big_fil_rev_8_21_14_0_10_31_59]PIZ80882.1 MAG: hypothetical protein COX99_01415 [Candidatus Pacearchaeota archaeon CG_4_10_14_0_2_um_filter_31_10]